MENVFVLLTLFILFSLLFLGLFKLAQGIATYLRERAYAKKINLFFLEHRTKKGELLEYIKEEGQSYTTLEFRGKYSPSRPALHTIPSRYYIRVKCKHNDLQYIAVYLVLSSDYNRLRKQC